MDNGVYLERADNISVNSGLQHDNLADCQLWIDTENVSPSISLALQFHHVTVCARARVCVRARVHACVHACMCVHARTCVHVCACIRVRVNQGD